MNKEKIRNYLENRYGSDEVLNLSEDEFQRLIFTAFSFLSVYFPINSFDEDVVSPIIAEEAIYIKKIDIDFNAYFEYSGLTTFDIAGAIKGTVGNQYNEYFSPIVKAMLEKEGLTSIISIGKVKNQFTYL